MKANIKIILNMVLVKKHKSQATELKPMKVILRMANEVVMANIQLMMEVCMREIFEMGFKMVKASSHGQMEEPMTEIGSKTRCTDGESAHGRTVRNMMATMSMERKTAKEFSHGQENRNTRENGLTEFNQDMENTLLQKVKRDTEFGKTGSLMSIYGWTSKSGINTK